MKVKYQVLVETFNSSYSKCFLAETFGSSSDGLIRVRQLLFFVCFLKFLH